MNLGNSLFSKILNKGASSAETKSTTDDKSQTAMSSQAQPGPVRHADPQKVSDILVTRAKTPEPPSTPATQRSNPSDDRSASATKGILKRKSRFGGDEDSHAVESPLSTPRNKRRVRFSGADEQTSHESIGKHDNRYLMAGALPSLPGPAALARYDPGPAFIHDKPSNKHNKGHKDATEYVGNDDTVVEQGSDDNAHGRPSPSPEYYEEQSGSGGEGEQAPHFLNQDRPMTIDESVDALFEDDELSRSFELDPDLPSLDEVLRASPYADDFSSPIHHAEKDRAGSSSSSPLPVDSEGYNVDMDGDPPSDDDFDTTNTPAQAWPNNPAAPQPEEPTKSFRKPEYQQSPSDSFKASGIYEPAAKRVRTESLLSKPAKDAPKRPIDTMTGAERTPKPTIDAIKKPIIPGLGFKSTPPTAPASMRANSNAANPFSTKISTPFSNSAHALKATTQTPGPDPLSGPRIPTTPQTDNLILTLRAQNAKWSTIATRVNATFRSLHLHPSATVQSVYSRHTLLVAGGGGGRAQTNSNGADELAAHKKFSTERDDEELVMAYRDTVAAFWGSVAAVLNSRTKKEVSARECEVRFRGI